MTTGEILTKAAGIVRRGWAQGTRDNYHGGHCALGAIGMAARRSGAFRAETSAPNAIRALATLLPMPDGMPWLARTDELVRDGNKVAEWNNAADQTAENVAQGLELAALLWEQDQKPQQDVPAVLVGVGV